MLSCEKIDYSSPPVLVRYKMNYKYSNKRESIMRTPVMWFTLILGCLLLAPVVVVLMMVGVTLKTALMF